MDKPRDSDHAASYERPLGEPSVGKLLPTALLAAVFGAFCLTIGLNMIHGSDLPFAAVARQADDLSQSERDDRARRFAAAAPLALEAVKLRDIDQAIASMALTSDQEKALRAELVALVQRDAPGPQASAIARFIQEGATPAAPSAATPSPAPTAASTPVPAQQVASAPAPLPQARPAGPPRALPPAVDGDFRLPMAWITLWDHVDEDGDVVRVVSTGYTRTISILHQPVTLAIPVPPSGIVNVIGVRDGVGGITVGIRSAMVEQALPVLSEGQIIGVPVVLK